MKWVGEGRGKSIFVKQREDFIVVIFGKIKEANWKKSEKKCYLLPKRHVSAIFQMCQEWLHLPMVSPLLWGAFL